MKLRNKIITFFAAVGLIPLITQTGMLYVQSTSTAADALEEAARRQLVSIRDTKAEQVEDYFNALLGQARTLSQNTMAINAMRGFGNAFDKAYSEDTQWNKEAAKQRLETYYRDEFAAKYREQNAGKAVDYKALLNKLDDRALYLQDSYISSNPNALGEKHLSDGAPAATTYNDLHRTYHPAIRAYLEEFGYYDIFLATTDEGRVVYSVFKELDFTTSLTTGAYADSGLGKAFAAASKLGKGQATLTDFAPYLPSYEGAAAFMAAPIYDGSEKLGVLIFQMPIERINQITTSHGNWEEIGLGKSGESYIVGRDLIARSESRFLLEDPAGYKKLMSSIGTNSKIVDEMMARGSNIGLQKLDTPATRAATSGKSGYGIITDYRDVEVLSAYRPLNIPGLDWALLTEIDEEEAFAGIASLESKILSSAALLLVIIGVAVVAIGLMLARQISNPIEALSEVIHQISGDRDLSLRAKITSNDEIGEMATQLNTMLSNFQTLVRSIIDATNELSTAATQMAGVSAETKSGMMRQRSETEQLATAMNEMVATVNEVARSTGDAAQAAEDSDHEAQAGKAVTEQTTRALSSLDHELENSSTVISRLSEDSNRIGSVLEVISGIAEQTNLLALNAAIEAARAGEQGRGFAVVADEVRTLAARTQDSTKEINAIIEGLQTRAREAVRAMESSRNQANTTIDHAAKAQRALENITIAVNRITEMNLHIASAAEQQNSVAEEINRNVVSISDIADSSAAGASQVSAASAELEKMGNQLQRLASQFRI